MVIVSLLRSAGSTLISSSARFSATGSKPRVLKLATSRFFSTAQPNMKPSIVVKRHENIIKSVEDAREYRGLEYSNGLRVLLVSDSKADKSAASMDVAAGHLMDRWEMPGTAHFCEHMLFLGTDKYPSENEYSKFVTSHAGSCNAFTSTDHTNYHFDIKPGELRNALDRFVQFFISPQFTESATEREVNAVHSEHSNNLNNDSWRTLQVDRHLSKRGHDYGKFGTGDKKTLNEEARQKGIEPRDELLTFHKQWYSSNIMCLTVLGKESLDELEAMVAELGFDTIENKQVERRFWNEHPWGPEQLKRRINVVPIKDLRSLKISFPVPDHTMLYKSQPDHYLSHLIGHEGEGSLLSELKKRGWVSHLGAGESSIARGIANYDIQVDLSVEGLQHVDEIVELVFQYIGMLKRSGVQPWVFQELHDVAEARFRFKDKENPMSFTTNLAADLQLIPFEDIVHHRFGVSELKPDLIDDLLARFNPDNMSVRVVAKSFAGQEGNVNEPVYGTEMRIEQIEEKKIERFRAAMDTPHEKFYLPAKNDYIPTQFDLKPRETETDRPRVIHDDQWSRVWFKQDDEYKLPKMVTKVSITSPMVSRCPKTSVLSSLLMLCLTDALAEETYAASIAGLRFHFEIGVTGAILKVDGFDEKLPLLVKHLVQSLVDFKADAIRFGTLFDALRRALQNFSHAQPYALSQNYMVQLLSERFWSKEQMLAVCHDITEEDVNAFCKEMLKAFHVEIFAHGNTTEKETLELASEVTKILRTAAERPLFSNEYNPLREHALEVGNPLLFRHFQDTHDVSAVEVLFQAGVQNTKDNAFVEMLMQLIREPAYNQLRTTEQLGYIVWSGTRQSCGTLGFHIIVQGPNEPDFVQERVEAFLVSSREEIANMSEQEFNDHREGLITKLLERPKTLGSRFNRFWTEIEARQYDFDRRVSEVEVLRDMTKDELLKFFDQKFAADAPERKKVAIYVHGKNQNKESLNGIRKRSAENAKEEMEEVECIDQVRQTLALYGRPRPKMRLPPFGVDVLQTHEEPQEKAKY